MDARRRRRERAGRLRRRRRLAFTVAALAVLVLGAFGRDGAGESCGEPDADSEPAVQLRFHDRPPPRRHAPARPPQFVVVSFDGAGGVRLWTYWRAVARRARAHFTFFVSGVYLLDEARRTLYHPPRHPAGSSDIGFAQPEGRRSARALVRGMLEQIATAYGEGHEIGTHFNGHFCAPYGGSVGEWSSADWRRELEEFDKLLFAAGSNNDLRPSVRLPFGRSEIVGARTPCLEGRLDALSRVLAQRGFRYDASRVGVLGEWPRRMGVVWSVPLTEIPLVGHTFKVVAMDYNFLANQTGVPARTVERETYRSLWSAFRASYHGKRAPLSIGAHFETWNRWAYDHAFARFVLSACRLPDVRCVSFHELVDWLDDRTRRE